MEKRLTKSCKLKMIAEKHGQKALPKSFAEKLCQKGWLKSMAEKRGRKAWQQKLTERVVMKSNEVCD